MERKEKRETILDRTRKQRREKTKYTYILNILPVTLYDCQTWSPTPRKERRRTTPVTLLKSGLLVQILGGGNEREMKGIICHEMSRFPCISQCC
jgi:hypothetical protein